jgi:hypothetical protein
MKKFEIIASSVSITNRPPISYKVREYFETFIIDHILTKKKIIVTGNWEIHLVLAFLPETNRYQSDDLFMPEKPVVVKEDKIKTYDILVPMKLIKPIDEPYLKTIELIYQAITLFLTKTYKKVTAKEMENLWESVDLKYLLSLPFPAPLVDQKYLTDVVTAEGNVVDFWDTVKAITYEGRGGVNYRVSD